MLADASVFVDLSGPLVGDVVRVCTAPDGVPGDCEDGPPLEVLAGACGKLGVVTDVLPPQRNPKTNAERPERLVRVKFPYSQSVGAKWRRLWFPESCLSAEPLEYPLLEVGAPQLVLQQQSDWYTTSCNRCGMPIRPGQRHYGGEAAWLAKDVKEEQNAASSTAVLPDDRPSVRALENDWALIQSAARQGAGDTALGDHLQRISWDSEGMWLARPPDSMAQRPAGGATAAAAVAAACTVALTALVAPGQVDGGPVLVLEAFRRPGLRWAELPRPQWRVCTSCSATEGLDEFSPEAGKTETAKVFRKVRKPHPDAQGEYLFAAQPRGQGPAVAAPGPQHHLIVSVLDSELAAVGPAELVDGGAVATACYAPTALSLTAAQLHAPGGLFDDPAAAAKSARDGGRAWLRYIEGEEQRWTVVSTAMSSDNCCCALLAPRDGVFSAGDEVRVRASSKDQWGDATVSRVVDDGRRVGVTSVRLPGGDNVPAPKYIEHRAGPTWYKSGLRLCRLCKGQGWLCWTRVKDCHDGWEPQARDLPLWRGRDCHGKDVESVVHFHVYGKTGWKRWHMPYVLAGSGSSVAEKVKQLSIGCQAEELPFYGFSRPYSICWTQAATVKEFRAFGMGDAQMRADMAEGELPEDDKRKVTDMPCPACQSVGMVPVLVPLESAQLEGAAGRRRPPAGPRRTVVKLLHSGTRWAHQNAWESEFGVVEVSRDEIYAQASQGLGAREGTPRVVEPVRWEIRAGRETVPIVTGRPPEAAREQTNTWGNRFTRTPRANSFNASDARRGSTERFALAPPTENRSRMPALRAVPTGPQFPTWPLPVEGLSRWSGHTVMRLRGSMHVRRSLLPQGVVVADQEDEGWHKLFASMTQVGSVWVQKQPGAEPVRYVLVADSAPTLCWVPEEALVPWMHIHQEEGGGTAKTGAAWFDPLLSAEQRQQEPAKVRHRICNCPLELTIHDKVVRYGHKGLGLQVDATLPGVIEDMAEVCPEVPVKTWWQLALNGSNPEHVPRLQRRLHQTEFIRALESALLTGIAAEQEAWRPANVERGNPVGHHVGCGAHSTAGYRHVQTPWAADCSRRECEVCSRPGGVLACRTCIDDPQNSTVRGAHLFCAMLSDRLQLGWAVYTEACEEYGTEPVPERTLLCPAHNPNAGRPRPIPLRMAVHVPNQSGVTYALVTRITLRQIKQGAELAVSVLSGLSSEPQCSVRAVHWGETWDSTTPLFCGDDAMDRKLTTAEWARGQPVRTVPMTKLEVGTWEYRFKVVGLLRELGCRYPQRILIRVTSPTDDAPPAYASLAVSRSFRRSAVPRHLLDTAKPGSWLDQCRHEYEPRGCSLPGPLPEEVHADRLEGEEVLSWLPESDKVCVLSYRYRYSVILQAVMDSSRPLTFGFHAVVIRGCGDKDPLLAELVQHRTLDSWHVVCIDGAQARPDTLASAVGQAVFAPLQWHPAAGWRREFTDARVHAHYTESGTPPWVACLNALALRLRGYVPGGPPAPVLPWYAFGKPGTELDGVLKRCIIPVASARGTPPPGTAAAPSAPRSQLPAAFTSPGSTTLLCASPLLSRTPRRLGFEDESEDCRGQSTVARSVATTIVTPEGAALSGAAAGAAAQRAPVLPPALPLPGWDRRRIINAIGALCGCLWALWASEQAAPRAMHRMLQMSKTLRRAQRKGTLGRTLLPSGGWEQLGPIAQLELVRQYIAVAARNAWPEDGHFSDAAVGCSRGPIDTGDPGWATRLGSLRVLIAISRAECAPRELFLALTKLRNDVPEGQIAILMTTDDFPWLRHQMASFAVPLRPDSLMDFVLPTTLKPPGPVAPWPPDEQHPGAAAVLPQDATQEGFTEKVLGILRANAPLKCVQLWIVAQMQHRRQLADPVAGIDRRGVPTQQLQAAQDALGAITLSGWSDAVSGFMTYGLLRRADSPAGASWYIPLEAAALHQLIATIGQHLAAVGYGHRARLDPEKLPRWP
eukprot:TRINITY_DN11140_c0_g1_i1.p1 TRINITY_DN11140_c0_g1~~TRINITY_DN11140_c0_g1_i1.p1  ORF type:complete len:2168 (+),score=407.39 TRINITY_DN11140_c0_g1_i1:621-6506(+)